MKKKFYRYTMMYLFMSIAWITSPVNAQNNLMVFIFDQDKLQITKKMNYDFIRYDDFELTQTIGAPQLPVKIFHIAVPEGRELAGVSIKNIKSDSLPGTFIPFPAQPPRALSDKRDIFIQPDQACYSSGGYFPSELVTISPTGNFSGAGMTGLSITPVQYLASKKKLLFISELEVELELKASSKKLFAAPHSEYSEMIRAKTLKKLIGESDMIDHSSLRKTDMTSASLAEEHRYVIITADNLIRNFQPLADWKLKKGLSAKIVKTSFVYNNYSGIDKQEKIRNFIRDARQNWGTVWVLLGGDTKIVPCRHVFAFDCESGLGIADENNIPSDLYYADLDGTWNANGNDVYGEVDDDIDMYPDVIVGRAPVENAAEATAFVNKVLSYEKNALQNHELHMLFLAEILWDYPYTNSGEAKDHIDNMFVPDRFDPIVKLYQHNGNENAASVIDALNDGFNLINHDGHAFTSVMGVGSGALYNSDMDALTNGSRSSVLFSIGCWPAAFDDDCIAEHFLTNPNGGGVAFIGNSRYGWGSPGNPLYGYSDRFDQQFFKSLLVDHLNNIGSALYAAKMTYVPLAAQGNVYRWCEYEINLLGDPEMPIWTESPRQFVVHHPATLPAGETQTAIMVTDGNRAIENAMVCLLQDETTYATGITGPNGTAYMDVTTADPSKALQITVTAHNFMPYENSISLVMDQPYVRISSCLTNGSAERLVTPNTLISMDCWFKNFGTAPAPNVTASLACANEKITFMDDSQSLGTIAPGDSVLAEKAFTFQTNSTLMNNEGILLISTVSDESGKEWSSTVSYTGATPVLSLCYYGFSDSLAGDGDDFAEPGEAVDMMLTVENSGLAAAQDVRIALQNDNSCLHLPESIFELGNITAGDSALVTVNFQLDAGCPNPAFLPVILSGTAANMDPFSDSLIISVGEFGILDDMEHGSSLWTHSGSPDLWHRTFDRKHSGHLSWYCGNKSNYRYDNNMDNCLLSDHFIVDHDSELSFWCQYELPNYGVNGLYPEVNDGKGWRKLDFIGSGGALGVLTTGNDWRKYTCALSQYPAGSSLQLRFRFVSDQEKTAEGVYIDDVIVQNKNHRASIDVPFTPPRPELEVNEIEKKLLFSWDANSQDIENFDSQGYRFQGYNIYQFASAVSTKSNGVRIATFDVIDDVTEIGEEIMDPETDALIHVVLQQGSDSGIQTNFAIDKDYLQNSHLIKGKPYYFAITAYAFNASNQAFPTCVENDFKISEIVYQKDQPGYAYGDTMKVTQISGNGDGKVVAIVKDPAVFTGHDYRLDFTGSIDTTLVWNVTDITLNKNLLSQQTAFGFNPDNPVVDGFQVFVKKTELYDFTEISIDGEGFYFIQGMTDLGSQSSRAVDILALGTRDEAELEQDYEFRITGEFMPANANHVVLVREGTGSLATLMSAWQYQLKDHPMNPHPGIDNPFLVRVPFEVWNKDENRQVNILLRDDTQPLDANPFFALSPAYFTSIFILNTPYCETVADLQGSDMEHLTWCLIFAGASFYHGDVVTAVYNDRITPQDVFTFNTRQTRVADEEDTFPKDCALHQNYPNPFNSTTVISFQISKSDAVKLIIYDVLGHKVRTLFEGNMQPGLKKIEWDGRDNNGAVVSSGIYFLKMTTLNYQTVRKMALIR